MKIEITGFSHSKGTSDKGRGKPYEMGRLFRLNSIRAWKNDFGESKVAGFSADERAALDIDCSRAGLVNKLLSCSYPQSMELIVEPHPDDPMRNIVVDVNPSVMPKNG